MLGLDYQILYKKGSENTAADALSRRPPVADHVLSVSTVQPTWLSEIIDSYQSDDKLVAMLQQLAVQPTSKPPYQLVNGLLRYKGSIWVDLVPALQLKIFSAFLIVQWEDTLVSL